MAAVNARHAVPGGTLPIQYYKHALGLPELVALYRRADFCIVSSLADGMNLVAKEFVAARDDEGGVLVLSALAGAAEELREALIINPYDVDGFASAITRAIDMDAEERRLGCVPCGAASRGAMSSAGRRTSSKGSRACGPNPFATRHALPRTRRSDHLADSQSPVANRPVARAVCYQPSGLPAIGYWLAAR